MQAELEHRHDAEVAATAAHAPVEVRVLIGVGVQVTTIRSNDVHGPQVVDREAVLPRETAEAATQRESADAGMRDRAGGRREPESRRLVVDLAQQAAA